MTGSRSRCVVVAVVVVVVVVVVVAVIVVVVLPSWDKNQSKIYQVGTKNHKKNPQKIH